MPLNIDPSVSHALACDLYAQLAAANDTIAQLRAQLAAGNEQEPPDGLPAMLRTDPNDGPDR